MATSERHEVKAVILAGGSGSRLYPLTEDTPTFMLPIGNRPLLWYQLEVLENTGFTSVLVLTSEAHAAQARDLLRQRGGRTRAEVLAVPADGGSGGALLRAREAGRLPGEFLLLPADVLLADPPALLRMADLHRAHQAAATVLLCPAPPAAPPPAAAAAPKKASKAPAVPAASPLASVVGLAGPPAALRLIFIQPAELFAAAPLLVLPKALLRAHPHVRMHSDFHDPHVYLFGPACWDLWEAKRKRKHLSVREDLLPALVRAAPAPASPASPQAAGGGPSPLLAQQSHVSLISSSALVPLRPALTASLSMLPLPLMPGGQQMPAGPGLAAAPPAESLDALPPGQLGAYSLSTSAVGLDRARELQSTDLRCYALLAAGAPTAPDPLSAEAAPLQAIRRLDSVAAYLELNRLAAAGALGRLPGDDDNSGVQVSPGAAVGAGCLLGTGSRVGEKASLKHAMLGRRCVVGAGCKLINAVLLDGVVLGDQCTVISSVLGRDVQLGDRCSVKDSALGSGVRVPAHSELVAEQLVKHPADADADDDDNDDGSDGPAPVGGRALAHSSGSEH